MRKFNKTLALVIFSLLMCALVCVAASAEYSHFTYDESGLTLENEHVIYSFNKAGRVTNYTFKDNSTNYLGSKSYFATLTTGIEEYVPTSLTLNSIEKDTALVTVTFGVAGVDFDFSITAYDEFFVFELLEAIPEEFDALIMGTVKLGSAYDGQEFASFSYALDYNTKMEVYPSRYATYRSLGCSTFSYLGNAGLGARFATVGCPTEDYYDVLRFIAEFVADPDRVPVSKMGGAYAMTEEVMDVAVQDYAILSSNPTDDVVRFYLDYNVTQFDFHQGSNSFVQGNMDFAESAGDTAEGFKTEVTDRIKQIAKDEYGKDVLMGLHTYAYYISTSNTSYLSDPEVVRQLEFFEDEVYTLSAAVNKIQTTIPVFEDVSEFDLVTGFFVYNSKYIRIDDEIMLVKSLGENLFNVARGQCGTTVAEHRKGSSVYHLTGLFGMLAPQLDSELFKDIAKHTGRSYVEGGFGMIYLDALDGIGRHTDETWYYTGLFLTEIMKEINRLRDTYPEYADVPDPIFEYSTMSNAIWGVRTRMGAMDTVCRGFKDFIAYHTRSNVNNTMNYTTNIGWYALYNTESAAPFYTHLQTWDVVDLLGKNIVAHNMGYSYNSFNQSSLEKYPRHRANADLLVKYLKLRDEGYFTNEVIEAISDYRDEWKLIEADGEWGFEHRDYSELKYNAMSDTRTASNPFEAQLPKLIRIQSLNTDAETEYVTLADFDEETEVTEYITSSGYRVEFASSININTYKALVVRVYGNGLGGKLNITMYSDDTTFSRVIPIDFTGWRDVVLAEVDNGINDQEFNSAGGYPFNRNTDCVVLYATFKTSGNMSGVMLDTVQAGKSVYSNITNPGVSYNGSSVVFNTTITSGSYVEFDGTSAVLYDLAGNATDVTYTVTGDLTAPAGDFSVSLLGTGSDYVDRAWVTMGFGGEQVFNDLTDEAVESIVVKTLPAKTSYVVGETLDTTGLSIYELMNTGRTADVESGWTVDEVTFTEAGIVKIPVSYDGFTTTFTVVVHEVAPVSLEISAAPARTSFYVGEAVDTTGLELTLTYNNGETETITDGFTASPETFTEAGLVTVTITWDKFSVEYEVDVAIPTLSSISITTLPTKTAYVEGEYFSTAGMVVTGIYSAGIEAEITDYTYSPARALTSEVTEIIIEKNGHRAAVPVTVTAAEEGVAFTVTAPDTAAVPGTSASVVVHVESDTVDAFESLEFVMSYDTRLVYVEGAQTTLPDGWDVWEVVNADEGTLKIALINESGEAAAASDIAVTLQFTVPETVENGEIITLEISDASASDSSFSYVEGAGSSFELHAETKLMLAAGSDFIIDRDAGLIYITYAEMTQEEFFANFAGEVTLSTSLSIVGTGAVVSLEKDGETVDSLTVILPGDVNGNGKIDSTDYTMAKRGYLGTLSLTSARSTGADANRNGFIDTNDYMLIKKHYSGEINMYE